MKVFLGGVGAGLGLGLAYLFGLRMSDMALTLVVLTVVNATVSLLLAALVWRVAPPRDAGGKTVQPQLTVLPLQVQPPAPPPASAPYGATLAPTALHYAEPESSMYLEV